MKKKRIGNGILVGILMFIILADCSKASLVLNSRKFANPTTTPPKNNSTQQTLPNPVLSVEKHNLTTKTADKSKEEKPTDLLVTKNTSNAPLQGSTVDNNATTLNSPTDKLVGKEEKDKEKKGKEKQKEDSTPKPQLDTNESCDKPLIKCRDRKKMLACIQDYTKGSKVMNLLIQNEGEITLMVNLTSSGIVDYARQFEIPSHQTEKINISLSMGQGIVLDAGNGPCNLDLESPSRVRNVLKQLTFYSKQLTPIYGAYLLLLVTLIFGATWACCMLRKRRWQSGGVAYQELEMGLPESASAVMETAEGWDHDWDEDWNEENAVRSPGGHHVGNISANGLISRSSKRDGWENDWDD